MYKRILLALDLEGVNNVKGVPYEALSKGTDEWKIAKQFVDQLNGIVPYSLIRGNHDSAAQFNATFNTEAYKSNFNGFYGENDICKSR